MDYLSRCYTFKLRPFRDSAELVDARWYFCRPGAKVYPGTHLFGSQVWRPESPNEPDGPGELFGPKRFDRGRNPGYLGHCSLGDPAWYAGGVPAASVTGTPPVLPACCFVQPPDRTGARSGFRGWSVVRVRNRWGAREGFRGDVATGQAGAWGLLSGGRDGATEAGFWGLLSGIGGIAVPPLYCSVRKTGLQSIAPSTATLLTWDTVEYDPSGFYSALDPSRLTVPADGLYLIQIQTMWNSALAGGRIEGDLYLNSFQIQTLFGDLAYFPGNNVRAGVALLRLVAGDYLGVGIFQTTPGGISPDTAGFYVPSFRIALLG